MPPVQGDLIFCLPNNKNRKINVGKLMIMWSGSVILMMIMKLNKERSLLTMVAVIKIPVKIKPSFDDFL